jgi:hypothetical protein
MWRILTLLIVCSLTVSVRAQVVQLPSMHTFSISTSVLVPDSGRAYLGGINRSSHWMSSRAPGWGPLGRNAGRGRAMSATGGTITATIIDNAELDALVLEEAKAIRAEKGIELPREPVARIKPPRDSSALSVAAIKRELAAADAGREEEAERDYHKALAYERAGEGALARSYYRVAARKSTGEVRQKSLERLATLAAKSKSTSKSR